MFCTSKVHNYLESVFEVRTSRDRRFLQPHFTSLQRITAPFANTLTPADGVCAHFLRRGLIKPQKTQMTCAVWTADARFLVLGTVTAELALWEGDSLKVANTMQLFLLSVIFFMLLDLSSHFHRCPQTLCWR